MTTILRDEWIAIHIYLFYLAVAVNIHEMKIIDSVRHLIEYCSHTLNLTSLQMTLKYEENKIKNVYRNCKENLTIQQTSQFLL